MATIQLARERTCGVRTVQVLGAGSIATSLTQLEQNLLGGTLSSEGSALVDQGRQKALSALKAAPISEEKTFLQDSALNRQLLGEIVVTNQALEVDGKLTVTGTALPGSNVTVKMPDGSTQQAVADAQGDLAHRGVSPPNNGRGSGP